MTRAARASSRPASSSRRVAARRAELLHQRAHRRPRCSNGSYIVGSSAALPNNNISAEVEHNVVEQQLQARVVEAIFLQEGL